MASLIIRGTKLMEFTGYCANSGQMTYELKCRAAWSDTVCEAMGWQKEPAGFGNGSLEGGLFGISMILEPSSKTLKDYRFDIAIGKVASFKHIAKTEDGDVVHRELEFVVTTTAEDAPVVFSRYMEKCCPGDDRGQAKIQYSEEEQQELGDEGAPAEKPRGRRKAAAEAEE